ncbi:MAG TPA: ABC transporter permease [Verrucomicrobiae bacterium]|jgi:peptide/nickel transport system permease protein|nr:ABC transporter permease [Verrucomicrobiae bacterium]
METTEPIPVIEIQALSSPWRLFWQRLRQRKIALVGGVILIVLYTVALFAGFISPYTYDAQHHNAFFHQPVWPRFHGFHLVVPRTQQLPGDYAFQEVYTDTKPLHFFVKGGSYKLLGFIPGSVHLFGTGDDNYPVFLFGADQFGRDIFSRLLYGSEISLSIGIVGILISFTMGLIIGGISGYFAGGVDTLLMRFCELIMSIPALYLIISLRNAFPPNISSSEVYAMIVVILSVIGWASMARVIRGMTLSLREQQFVLAARVIGQSHFKVICRHILPNTFSYVIVAATLSVPYYILGEVVLSYLGVGIQEPQASWGLMLNEAQNTEYLQRFPWLLAPGAAIFITVLAFNFLGDGLRDAADTKQIE